MGLMNFIVSDIRGTIYYLCDTTKVMCGRRQDINDIIPFGSWHVSSNDLSFKGKEIGGILHIS